MAYTPNPDPRYYAQPTAFRCNFGASAVTSLPTASALAGTAGVGTLVPINANQPQELQYLWAIGRGSLAASTIVLAMSDGTTISIVDWLTHASQTAVTTTQGNARLPFSSISKDQTIIVPPTCGLYLYSTVAQAYDAFAGPGGIY